MPEELNDGFVSDEAPKSEDNNIESASAPRRRRGGRRVVRGAGAAGASVELKVEEHAPLFKEPEIPALPAPQEHAQLPAGKNNQDADSADNTNENDSETNDRPANRRRRSANNGARTSRKRANGEESNMEELPARSRRHTASADADNDELPTRSRRRTADNDYDDDELPARNRRRITDADLNDGGAPVRTRRRNTAAHDQDEDMPVRSRKRNLSEDYEEDDAPVRTRSRRRSVSRDNDEEPRNNRRRARNDYENEANEDSDERAFDAVESLPGMGEPNHNASSRPMTSLLFQEPVLPVPTLHVQDEEPENKSKNGRKRNVSEDEEEQNPSRSRSRRSNRRLNAQERRAAAEVEQIEEDLVLDDITYAPISDESKPKAHDDDEEQMTHTRRRRRSRSRENQEKHESEENANSNGKSKENKNAKDNAEEESEEEGTVTRRRHRRRKNSADDEEQPLTRRSRKQQYIDEITDVAGSTRLEAKKQRRRDNRRERSRQNQLLEQDFLARRENVERLMVVRERERHTQISVIEDNVLVEHYVSDIQEVATVGNIYLGRVQNVLPSMEAAFVDIGQARNGVLYAGEVNWDTTRLEGQPRRIELAFKPGDPVLVQVTKDPIGHKGARLTSQVTLAGRFLVLVPSGGMTGVSRKLSERERGRLKNIVSKIAPKDMGVIIRTAAEGAPEDAIVKDLENLMRQWTNIESKMEEFRNGKRPKLLQGEPDMAIRVVRDIFNDDFSKMIVEGGKVYERIAEYLDTMAPDLSEKLEKWDPAEHEGKDVFDKWQIDSQLRKGMERQVYLPSGGSIVIDRTEAMTTIDVNTGRFIGKGKSLEETVTRCNLEASEEIARQLRLRDIGGMVMIDYVDMVMPANRDLVLRRLVECLARDRTKHQVAEVTSLGLVQMTRKRIGQGLVEAFSEECPTCKGRGFIVHDEPTVSSDYDDPYALKGGDPFVKTNKHGHGSAAEVHAPKGSSAAVKAKLAQIAAAAVAANNSAEEAEDAAADAEAEVVQEEHEAQSE